MERQRSAFQARLAALGTDLKGVTEKTELVTLLEPLGHLL